MFDIFDPIFEAIARLLAFFFELPVVGGSYGISIVLLTLAVMLVLMPLTLKATRSTIAMQFVQPELKALQKKYKDDKQMLNQETMALYREKGINPVGGCLPILAQLPVFLVLYRIFIGLTTRNSESPFFGVADAARSANGGDSLKPSNFNPKWVPQDSEIYEKLVNSDEMPFGPFDLAVRAGDVFQRNPFEAIPYILLILVVVAGSYYQQRQISARRDGAPLVGNPMQQQLMKVMPLMSGVWGFLFPAALMLYQATSSLFRIGQQAYITRSFYRGEESIGKRAASAIQDSKVTDDSEEDKSANKKPKKKVSGKKEKSKSSNGTSDSDESSGKKDRNQAWADRRQQKSKAQKSRANGKHSANGRVTPKGTKSPAARKKRKR